MSLRTSLFFLEDGVANMWLFTWDKPVFFPAVFRWLYRQKFSFSLLFYVVPPCWQLVYLSHPHQRGAHHWSSLLPVSNTSRPEKAKASAVLMFQIYFIALNLLNIFFMLLCQSIVTQNCMMLLKYFKVHCMEVGWSWKVNIFKTRL